MRTTTYKCDRCGGESQNADYLQTVTATIIWKRNDWQSTITEAGWCEGCLEEMNIRKPTPKKDPQPTPPSLEELLRTIVREEIENRP